MGAVRSLLLLTGVVAVLAGAYGAATGIEGMSGESAATTNVDSEYRFLSAFWLAFGLIVLRVGRRPTIDPRAARALMLVLLCGGLARALSWAVEGRPDDLYLVLMALELGVPVAVFALVAGKRQSLP